MDTLSRLFQLGQSCWLDDLNRHMLTSGQLARLVATGVHGVTSNPSTFAKALASGDYDRDIERAAAAGSSVDQIWDELAISDVREACDVFRPVYDQTNGADGYVSLEVSPHLAHDTAGSIAEGRRLAALVQRPNLFIKIPGTEAGLPAIEELLFDGVNVNITLLFSVPRYQAVAQAYLRALERRLEAGQPIDRVASVASFFLSRIDVLVDQLLHHRFQASAIGARDPDPETLLGKTAVANAKIAYQKLQQLIASERWRNLAAKGARVQRLLWASTGQKNVAYPELMYVEPLIGPMTINTMPEKTIDAFLRSGRVETTIERGAEEAQQVVAQLQRLRIDFDFVATELENGGIEKFNQPYDWVRRELEKKRTRYARVGEIDPLRQAARRLRRLVIEMTTEAGSGHPTSCLSCADIIAALFFRVMRWDPHEPAARDVDTFILSKGHAAPILWAALHEAGASNEDLLKLRRIDSPLEGHPTPLNPWVKIATGSLGQGLCAANGIAAANRLAGIDARVFCLLGDAECSEGSVWEAAQFASLNKLTNLVAIVDMNALGQSGFTPYRHDTSVLAHRFSAFGWHTLEIDGHDMAMVVEALESAGPGPTAIIARTVKGKGVSFLEGKEGWHGKPLDREKMAKALAELGEPGDAPDIKPRHLGCKTPEHPPERGTVSVSYRISEEVATRAAFGSALAKLGELNPAIVVLDGDVKNSTGTEKFAIKYPERFFEGYIAEQNMIGTALGLAAAGMVPYAATFAAFLSRAYDFIRMAQYSRPEHLVICGSHAGVSIGEDGPSQMALEDIAMFRALIKSTVLYPADAVSVEKLTEVSAQTPGIVYLRTSRPKTPVIYGNDEGFPVGGSKTLHSSADDQVAIIAAGITLFEALAVYEELQAAGISVRVIDAYSVKPLDVDTILRAAAETGALVVVEDHAVSGGLGEAVAAAVGTLAPVERLGVERLPRSGTREQLLDYCGISRHAIMAVVRDVIADRSDTTAHPSAARHS